MTDYHVIRIKFINYERKKMFERSFQIGYGSGYPKVLVDHFTHGSHGFEENEAIYFMKDINLESFKKYIKNNDEFIQYVATLVINSVSPQWSVLKAEEINAQA